MTKKTESIMDAERARAAGVKARHLVEVASAEVSEATSVVEKKILEKPLQASVIALAAGVVLGLLLRRR